MWYQNAKIKSGKFYSDKEKFNQMVANMSDGNYIYCLIKHSDRTCRQNQNFYFTQLGDWSLSTGYSKEELHELVKNELFVDLFGSPQSTSDLDKNMWAAVFFNLENFLLIKFENK